jgi:VanZ family protein
LKRFLGIHGPSILWAVFIGFVSSIPSLTPPDLGFNSEDKVAHALVYGIFGYFLSRSFRSIMNRPKHALFAVLLVGALYAGIDEIHQLFIRGRVADVLDFAADLFGLCFSQMVVRIARRS